MNEWGRKAGRSLALDEDALKAAVDVVGRSGARGLEIGYVNDEAERVEDGQWFAYADFMGARIIEEDHQGPVEAVEALARRILTGAVCKHCSGLIALSDDGAMIFEGVMRDGSIMTAERARTMRQCRWTRHEAKWVPGCTAGRRNQARRQRDARARLKAKRKQGRR